MKVLQFVHTYGERNGISIHVRNLVSNYPQGVKAQVISGSGGSLPFFSSLKVPFFEFFRALGTDFDVVHIHGYGNFFSYFGAVLSVMKGRPLVWTIHGYPRIGGARKILYYFYRYAMAPLIFWRAKRIISVSSDIVPLLKKETRKEIEHIPNGVDLGTFKPLADYSQNTAVCYVGRLDADKGIFRMFECEKLPILFIGPDEDGNKKKLEAEAKRLGREASFLEVGYEEMPSAYAKCRYVFLPSKYEGFPLMMLEAIACGIPFISTPVGEVGKVLAGLFPKPEKYLLNGKIGKKIEELEKENLRAELAGARERMEKYSWKAIAARLAAIYEEAVGAKPETENLKRHDTAE